MTADELLTVAQVAELLHAHPETVRLWLKAGRLAGFMPGGKRLGWRIRRSDLERFIAEGGNRTPPPVFVPAPNITAAGHVPMPTEDQR